MQIMREAVFDPLPSVTERAEERVHADRPDGLNAWFARGVARAPADRCEDGGETCHGAGMALARGKERAAKTRLVNVTRTETSPTLGFVSRSSR